MQWRVTRTPRPLSRGMRYVLENRLTGKTHTAYSAAEMRAIRDGTEPERLEPMPGARAAIVRPLARYF